MSNLPTIEFLRECFSYDGDTGKLTWCARPRRHFAMESKWKRYCTMNIGKVAGTNQGNGYLQVRVTFEGEESLLLVHRICWAIETGAWPNEQVDHIDGDRSNNKFANLREATNAENQQNRTISKHNKSGFMGVCWFSPRQKFKAEIRINNKRHHLGYFDKAEDASSAYQNAKSRLHTFNPVVRSGL